VIGWILLLVLARLDSDASVSAGFDNEEVVSHSLTTFFGEAGGGMFERVRLR
jgi:hypothetical protein